MEGQTVRYVGHPEAPDPQTNARGIQNSAHYCSTDVMQQEWTRIWSNCWLLAGLEQDLREEGDFLRFDVGAESILIVRDATGRLNAFYNVCQHRGNRLQRLPFGNMKDCLSCPYHGWQYGLDGQLLTVPDRQRFSDPPTAHTHSLKPVNVDSWGGLVFVNMNPNPMPLAVYLGPLVAELAPYQPEKMKLVREQTCALDANWKTVLDNFGEVYHVDFLHPQHASFVDCRDAEVELYPFGHTAFKAKGYVLNPRYPTPETPPPILAGALEMLGLDPADFHGRVNDVRVAVQRRKRELGAEIGFDYSGLSDAQVSDIWQYNLFPNVVMTVKPEELWIMRPRPHPSDPNRCLFDKLTLAMPIGEPGKPNPLVLVGDPEANRMLEEDERPEPHHFTQDDVNAGRVSMTDTVDQDIFYLPDMQAGMRSAGFDRALLNDDEIRLKHFHDWHAHWLTS